ncbi:MAG: alpha/beta hydrolase [Polaromonas sp.]|nr:alpha/beta hydrolase [Polaromonas sp.]
MNIKANGIDIEVEDSGTGAGDSRARPVVLLIMGLGMQLIAWPPALVDGLVDAGYRVVRFDNRDIGLSRHLDDLGTPTWSGKASNTASACPSRRLTTWKTWHATHSGCSMRCTSTRRMWSASAWAA